jgi:quercetin dioxygenase-like cupin family protein/predicted small integral membrane protein
MSRRHPIRWTVVALVLAGAAVWTAVALATPGKGQQSTILSMGTFQGDLAFNTGLGTDATGLTWQGKQYSANRLPEFLMRLRSAGVTNVGQWLNLHPAISAKFGMVPVGLLHSPEVVTQQAKFAPGATSGWHNHPGYLTGTVISGQVVRYGTDCSAETFGAGQTFYETAAQTFVIKNESNADAVVLVTFVVPGGTPTKALRIDQPQPASCAK